MFCKRNREEYISILFQNRNHSINICQVEAKTWVQPKCPLIKEWIKKMWYMYTMDYYSAIKKKERMPFAATWTDPEIIMLSEVSQTKRDKYHMILLTCRI